MFQFDRIARSAKLLKEENKERRQQMLRELFDGYEAGLEMPVSACVDDLVGMYPDAKVRFCVSGVQIRGGCNAADLRDLCSSESETADL
jgi:hypothetical protein